MMNLSLRLLLLLLLLGSAAPALAAWAEALGARVEAIDAGFDGELGVWVHDLEREQRFGWRADEPWYLASGVKVLVAIAVLRAFEAGDLALDDAIVLQADDYVDGAGSTNRHPPGRALTIAVLLEQMIVHSDNTASDMLIRRVRLAEVNAIAAELMPAGAQITTLADVRRYAYSGFHHAAMRLGSADLLALKQRRGEARVALLADRLGVPRTALRLPDLDAAFETYYASRLNSASLQDFGQVFAALVDGRALGADGTALLLQLMRQTATGERRLKAGLPAGLGFAHKTGTQHRRACDFGVANHAGRALVIAACARGARSLARSERALREVGAAIAASGLLAPPEAIISAP